jgi:hypothetical protein
MTPDYRPYSSGQKTTELEEEDISLLLKNNFVSSQLQLLKKVAVERELIQSKQEYAKNHHYMQINDTKYN